MPGNALKLEPWDTADRDESFPQVPGASAGSWGNSTSPDSPTRPTTGLCGLECDEPAVSRNRSPSLRQRMVLSNRDKESLLEEIIDLKRALSDQAYHLKLHRVHFSAIQLENRKLEKDIEDLEVSGNLEAPRTGGPSRLRAKLQGLRTRLGDLQATCDIQHDELCQLRRDIRVAHTRECEVERDVYAAEIGRLQKVVKRLKALQLRITSENRELSRLKDKAARLELANQRLEGRIAAAHKTMERAQTEVSNFRAKGLDSIMEAKRSSQKIKELQEQAALMEELLEKERIEKRKIEAKIKAIAQKKKDWDREWDAAQKKKQLAAAQAEALLARKKHKPEPPEVRKDRGAHATEYGSSGTDSSSDSDDGKETALDRKRKHEDFEARKKQTLDQLEQRKNSLLRKIKVASHNFVEKEQKHYDKVISHSGGSDSSMASSLSPKERQKQQDIESTLYADVDGAAISFMDQVEEIHYGSKVPKLNLAGLSPKEAEEAKARYDRDVADAHKRAKKRGKLLKDSVPGSAASTSGYSEDSSMTGDSDDSRSGVSATSSGADSRRTARTDNEFGKNGKKMSPQDFEERKMSFLNKARLASQTFIKEEQNLYGKILSEVDSGVRTPGSIGWFSSTSSISPQDKQEEEVLESHFYEGVETAVESFLGHMEDIQYGKHPKLRLEQLRQEENLRIAREREEKMRELAEIEERARKKAEREAAERWTSGQNKIDVMIDQAILEDDEFTTAVKEDEGRLSVEINLKRTTEHPYPGSPRAVEEARLAELRKEEARLAEIARIEAIAQAELEVKRKAEMERQQEIEVEKERVEKEKEEARKEEIRQKWREEEERERFAGLTAKEDTRRRELEAKLAAGIPLTAEEEAELQALQAKIRGPTGLTRAEEARLKELEEKIRSGIPLTPEEEAELKALKAKIRGKSGLTAAEEARLKELEAKLRSGIPLTFEEAAELKALRARLKGKSGLTARQESRLKELEAKLNSGIPLTAEEEAELKELRAQLIGKNGLTGAADARRRELEAKLAAGIPLTAEEEAELKALQSQVIGESGLTVGEEDRLKELEAKLAAGIPLTEAEERELKTLQARLKLKSQLTDEEDKRRKELEAKVAAGIPLTEEEERELKELQAKRWGKWPLTASEDARRKELEAKLRSGIELTPEEEAELRALQAKLRGKFQTMDFGDVDMSKSDEMRKKGKLQFIDAEMQGFIKENIRGVLGHLENITEVIVHKQAVLAKHEAGAAATSGAAMDVLHAAESSGDGEEKTHKTDDHKSPRPHHRKKEDGEG